MVIHSSYLSPNNTLKTQERQEILTNNKKNTQIKNDYKYLHHYKNKPPSIGKMLSNSGKNILNIFYK